MSDPVPASRHLDRKLATIAAGAYTADDFILADAKDADMAFGVTAAGARPGQDPPEYRSRPEYLDAMRQVAAHGAIDILLTSAANGEQLVKDGGIDDAITLAVRGNDTTDVWNVRGASYTASASRPFRTANLAAIRPWCDLVLYSMTFNNDVDRDVASLRSYADFRAEAAALGMRHFLEVFNPNAPTGLAESDVPAFVADSIVRALAGVTAAERPLFLKVAYNGAAALTELAEHDPTLVVGVLGGSAGTTRDTFELLHRAEAHGARVALFGRKIQRAESQTALLALMRPVLTGRLSPADAVRRYHDDLAAAGITPHRELSIDLEPTDLLLRDE